MGYCYLIIPKKYVKKYNANQFSNKNICKLGKTDEPHPEDRMHTYSRNCKVIIVFYVRNSSFVEKELIKTFKLFFKRRKDLGNEYFEGSVQSMINEFVATCVKFNKYIDEFNIINNTTHYNSETDSDSDSNDVVENKNYNKLYNIFEITENYKEDKISNKKLK